MHCFKSEVYFRRNIEKMIMRKKSTIKWTSFLTKHNLHDIIEYYFPTDYGAPEDLRELYEELIKERDSSENYLRKNRQPTKISLMVKL